MTYLEYAKAHVREFDDAIKSRGLTLDILESSPGSFWTMFVASFCPWELRLCEKDAVAGDCTYLCEECWRKEMEETE